MHLCYERNGERVAWNYRVMDGRGYRLGELLRFLRALQTSRVLHNSIVHAKA